MTSTDRAPAPGGEAGFSLLEVLVALTILMTVLISVSTLLATTFKVGANSRYKQEATQIASSTLDAQLATGVATLLAKTGDTALPSVISASQDYRIEMEVAPYQPGSASCVSPASNSQAMLKVSVWVSWADVQAGTTWWRAGTTGATGMLVEETSLLAVPAVAINPNLGSILVSIQGAAGNGISDVTVTATPPSGSGAATLTATTTQGGCALFANVVTGTWSIAFGAQAGYIDEQNDWNTSLNAPAGLPAQPSVSVSASATSTLAFVPTSNPASAYDKEATVTPVYAVPMADGVHPIVPTNVNSLPLSFYSANLTTSPYVGASPAVVFPMPNTPSYYVVAGSCGAESAPGGGSVAGQPVTLLPGGSASPIINLVPVQIFVNQGGALVSPAAVTASVSNAAGTGADTNCPTTGPGVMPTLSLGSTTTVWAAFSRGPRPRSNVILVSSCNPCATTTTVANTSNATYGSPVTFTATVTCSGNNCGTPNAGTVTFTNKSTSTTMGTGTLDNNGNATFTTSALPVGTTQVTATYGGSGKWSASPVSSTRNQIITASPTTTALVSNPNPNAYGTSAILTATVSANAPSAATPTGTVTFTNGGFNIAGCINVALSSGAASCTLSGLSGGSYTVQAAYSPAPANFLSSTSSTVTQSVTAASTTTALTSSANPSTFNSSVTLTATVTPASGAPAVGSVVFKNGSTTLATVALNGSGVATYATSALPLGSQSLSAVFTATNANNFGPSTGTLTQVVNAPAGTPYTLCGLPYGVWLLSATYTSGGKTYSSANEPTQVVVTITPAGISLNGGAVMAAGSSVVVFVK